MKFLILTTNKRTLNWKSLDSKLKDIRDTLDVWDIQIEYLDTVPKIVKGRVDHEWFLEATKPYFDKGHDVIGLHMGDRQRRKWGLKPSLRGSNQRSGEIGDFYFWADENTKRNGENQFIQTCLHEFAHEYFYQTNKPDITHYWHNGNPDIRGLFQTFNWSLYQPRRMKLKQVKNLLERLVELLKAQKQVSLPIHPVDKYRDHISQPYGTPNKKWYPRTGHHIGTDYATPRGTDVLAPMDGEVTVSGRSDSMGLFCYYKYKYDGVPYVARFMHLSRRPKTGLYKQGERIGVTGNTGQSTGSHLHIDIFLKEVRVDILTPKNWRDLTINPETHYV